MVLNEVINVESKINVDLIITALRDYRRWYEDDEEEAKLIEEQIEIIEDELIGTEQQRTWACWNLSEEDIRQIAIETGISPDDLTGSEYEEIAQRFIKATESAMDGWNILLEDAIRQVKPPAKVAE